MGISLAEMEKVLEDRGMLVIAAEYRLDELLFIIAWHREIKDGDNMILGVGLPTTAQGHGRGTTCFLIRPLSWNPGVLDIEPSETPEPRNRTKLHAGDLHIPTDLFKMFTMTYQGFVDICFFGVAQDRSVWRH